MENSQYYFKQYLGVLFMFRLKDSIEMWKQKLSNSNSFTNSDIEELESHLLDEIEILKEKELTEEEAFYVASSRLGSVELLSSEFTKINAKSIYFKRVVWLLGGYILISFIQQLITTFSLFSTNYIYTINAFHANNLPYLSFMISIIISTIFLYFLIIPKYKLLSKIQSNFNYLFNYKRLFLVLSFVILTIMNSIGFNILRMLIMNNIVNNMAEGGLTKATINENMFAIIWSIILCLTFMLLSLRESRN